MRVASQFSFGWFAVIVWLSAGNGLDGAPLSVQSFVFSEP
jgi:hypothetical protein